MDPLNPKGKQTKKDSSNHEIYESESPSQWICDPLHYTGNGTVMCQAIRNAVIRLESEGKRW